MLKPTTDKRDWFLFHMTPLGMGLGDQQTETKTDRTTAIALTILGGVLAAGILLAAYLSI